MTGSSSGRRARLVIIFVFIVVAGAAFGLLSGLILVSRLGSFPVPATQLNETHSAETSNSMLTAIYGSIEPALSGTYSSEPDQPSYTATRSPGS